MLASSVQSLYISSWVPVQAQVASPVNITHPLGQIPAKVEVQVKVQESGNDVIFPASGSAQRDDDSDNVYGGVVYFYNEFHVKIFVPVKDENTAKGVAIYTGNGAYSLNYLSFFSEYLIDWSLLDQQYFSHATAENCHIYNVLQATFFYMIKLSANTVCYIYIHIYWKVRNFMST